MLRLRSRFQPARDYVGGSEYRQFRLGLASDLVTARAQSMNAVTTGDKVRCFNVMRITGHGSVGSSIGNTL